VKRLTNEASTGICDPDRLVTQQDLNKLEKHLDTVWNKLGIDIAFTRHFLDRVNDARNGTQITLCELARIFMETFRQHMAVFKNIPKKDWEAVLMDKKTNVNVPFILKHNGKEVEIVAKTIMRKPNFHTPDPKLMVAHMTRGGKRMKTLREWAGFGEPQNTPVGGVFAADDVSVNTSQVEDPEVLGMLNGFLSSLTNRTYINPYYPVHLAWIKLQAVGLSFEMRTIDLGGDQGCVYVPCTQFGGRLGRDVDGTWVNDDGLSNKIPGGISLKINYQQEEGQFSVSMQLVVGMNEDAELMGIDEATLTHFAEFPIHEQSIMDVVKQIEGKMSAHGWKDAGSITPRKNDHSFVYESGGHYLVLYIQPVKSGGMGWSITEKGKLIRQGPANTSADVTVLLDIIRNTPNLKESKRSSKHRVENVQNGDSDATSSDYPYDKTFQPTQDGETIFDSFMRKSRKIVAEALPLVKKGKDGHKDQHPSASEWLAHYKDKPLATIRAAYDRAEASLHAYKGNDLDIKKARMDKFTGINQALRGYSKRPSNK